ncbi:hypothetical protein ABIF69_005886 [Bradyrhizobium japonicum]
MSDAARREYNKRFVERTLARRPAPREKYVKAVTTEAAKPGRTAEGVDFGHSAVDVVCKAIVRGERPVLFVKDDWIEVKNVRPAG